MNVTKKQIFEKALEVFGSDDKEVVETNRTFISGKYKYYKKDNTIIKEVVEVKYIGGKYERVKNFIVFVIEKSMGAIKVLNRDTKQIIINFTHKTEPLILI